MSSGSLGGGTFEFRGDDSDFQKKATDVERTFVLMGKTFKESELSPEWVKALESAGAAAGGASGPLNRVAGAIRNVGGASDGTRSSLTALSQALEGRRIASQTAEVFLRIGHAAEEMATKIRLGTATTQDLIEKLAEGIPIIGRFIEAGRDIHEAIFGEKAYTEAILAQAKAQDDRTAALFRYLDAVKQVGRDTDDLTKKLRTKQGITFDITGFVTGGEREAEDMTGKLKERFQKQFEDIAEQRKKLSQKLQDLERENVPTAVTTGPGGQGGARAPDPRIGQSIDAARNQIATLDSQAASLREKITNLESLSRELIGRKVITEVLGRFGQEFVKATDMAKGAMESYIANLPRMTSETQRQLGTMTTAWEKFQMTVSDAGIDLSKGLISNKQFGAIQFKAFFDNATKPLEDFFKQKGAALGATLLQSFNAAPFINVFDQVKNLFSDFGDKRKPEKPDDFRSRSFSVEGLGIAIQEAAASRTGGDIPQKQLAAQQTFVKQQQDVLAALVEIKKNTAKPGYAVVK
jgi:hypothetical protein